MNTIQIGVIGIFVVLIIVHIILISSSNLDYNGMEDYKKWEKNMEETCSKITNVEEKTKCDLDGGLSLLSTLNNRDSAISNINMIGIIIGILLGVIQINYLNKMKMTNSLKLTVHIVLLIIYITLIVLSGASYSDKGIFVKQMIDTMLYDQTKAFDIKTNYTQLALKPLVPFLCALSITSLGIIITTIDESSSKSSNNYSSISSTDSMPTTESL